MRIIMTGSRDDPMRLRKDKAWEEQVFVATNTKIPILFLFEDDGVVQVLDVELGQTMDEVASAAAKFTVGLRVAPKPGRILRVRLHATDELLARNATVKDLGWEVNESIDVIYE